MQNQEYSKEQEHTSLTHWQIFIRIFQLVPLSQLACYSETNEKSC